MSAQGDQENSAGHLLQVLTFWDLVIYGLEFDLARGFTFNAVARVLYAMAEDGEIPRFLAKLYPGYGVRRLRSPRTTSYSASNRSD
jgi:hypothetical protein